MTIKFPYGRWHEMRGRERGREQEFVHWKKKAQRVKESFTKSHPRRKYPFFCAAFLHLDTSFPNGKFIYHKTHTASKVRIQKKWERRTNQFMMFLIYFKNNSIGKLNFFLMCVLSIALKASTSFPERRRRWKRRREEKKPSRKWRSK